MTLVNNLALQIYVLCIPWYHRIYSSTSAQIINRIFSWSKKKNKVSQWFTRFAV